ncbi:hypothetical protein BDR06DRAFT_391900 [Suillus hirtellus]|nr:hypothetical protein BDR06DRAFT_391900 [Suillus hirtellus]
MLEGALCGVVDRIQETKKDFVDGAACAQCPRWQAHFDQGLSLPASGKLDWRECCDYPCYECRIYKLYQLLYFTFVWSSRVARSQSTSAPPSRARKAAVTTPDSNLSNIGPREPESIITPLVTANLMSKDICEYRNIHLRSQHACGLALMHTTSRQQVLQRCSFKLGSDGLCYQRTDMDTRTLQLKLGSKM